MSQTRELGFSNRGQLELLRAFAERGARLRTQVTGASMRPFIRDGDVVTLAPMDGRSPRVGEVAAAVLRDPERLVVHRVVARRAGGWIIRGDACPRADGVVAAGDILASVERVERDGRARGRGAVGARPVAGAVAALARHGALASGVRLEGRLRRAGAAALRTVQSIPAYRALGRRLGSRVSVAAASAGGASRDTPPERPEVTGLVARWRGVSCGAAQLVVTREAGSPWAGHWLLSLRVPPALRGLGIGETLAREALARARDEGADAVYLAVREDNARAIALYRKLGFTVTVLPRLEPILAEEGARLGRRRVAMRLPLEGRS